MSDRPPRRSWPRRMLNRLEVDQAVFFAIAARGWQFVAGPLTLVLIANYFPPEVQGYYYTFWSLIALQTFFELAFPQVILNLASHEWEKLSLGSDGAIQGDPDALSRLASLARMSLVIYGVASLLFWVIVSGVGMVFFARDAGNAALTWQLPWLVLVGLTAVTFALAPLLTLLEGCSQVKPVYRLQLVRAVSGNLAVWVAIPLGAALWVPGIAAAVRLVLETHLIAIRYRRFWSSLFRAPRRGVLDWKTEVWPFQWRLGLKGLFGYTNNYIVNPVIFEFFGPAAAGKFGMTWQVLGSLQGACSSWVRARAARFGVLVAQRNFAELDRVFFRVAAIGATAMSFALAAFWVLVYWLYATGSIYAERLLAPLPTAFFSVAMLIMMVSDGQQVYIHAHRRSPFLALTLAGTTIHAVLVVWWSALYGVTGASVAYLLTGCLCSLPLFTYAWYSCRADFQRGERRG